VRPGAPFFAQPDMNTESNLVTALIKTWISCER